jgi:hypothetical protein
MEESEKVLFSVLCPFALYIRSNSASKWFKYVDSNEDDVIDVQELAAYFQKNNFKEPWWKLKKIFEQKYEEY